MKEAKYILTPVSRALFRICGIETTSRRAYKMQSLDANARLHAFPLKLILCRRGNQAQSARCIARVVVA